MAKFKSHDRVRNLVEIANVPKDATGIVSGNGEVVWVVWVAWDESPELKKRHPNGEYVWCQDEAYLELIEPNQSTIMTKREQFAMAAMQGLLASYQNAIVNLEAEDVATISVEYADALITALNK